MAELLKRWVNGLGTSPITNFERDLSNGFCFGEILAHPDYDLLTAESFAAFMANDSAEAKVTNFQLLAPVFRDLGIKFDSLMANQIMVEKQGVALRLLHQIKQSLQSLQQNAFSTSSKVLGFDPEQTQSTKETGSVAYLSSQKSLGKSRYEDIEKTRFDDRMRKMVPNSYEQKLAGHLKKFQDHADYVAEENFELQQEDDSREQQEAVDRRQGMLDRYQQNKQFGQEWQSQGVAVHRANQSNRRAEIKRSLRFELAQTTNKDNREKMRQANASDVVVGSIDSFETTLRRLGKLDSEELTDDSIKTHAQAPQSTALEHMQSIEQSLANFDDMQSAANSHIRSLKKKKAEEDTSRKERERRRRKVLLDQQSAQKELEERRREEMLLEKLCRQSKEERKLAEMLWECQLHKDVMRENRFFRDKQEQAQAARDKELKLEAEKAIRAKAYEEYQRQVENTVKRRDEFEATLNQEKTAKNEAVALELIDGILQIVARVDLYKEKTDGQFPDEEYVQWCATMAAGEAVWPPPEPEPDAEELARMAQEAADIRDPVRVADAKRLDDMEWERYLSWTGVWGCAEAGGAAVGQTESRPPTNGANNPFLCEAVSELQLAIAPVVPQQAPPVMPKFAIRACVLGKPYSGKSDVCKRMEQELGCRRLAPDDIVSGAIDAYRAIIFDKDNEEAVARDVQLQLGKRAFEQLSEGVGVDDETIVALLVHAIQSLDTEQCGPDDKPASGWVLDGFPSTLRQAKLFEQSTSGFVEASEASSAFSSRLAAPADGPVTTEAVTSDKIKPAVGMVVRLDIEDQTVEERAHGHMVDINDNLQRYHLSSDPPELGQNKFLNLVPEENESSADLHIGPRLRCYKENEFQLMHFFDAFDVVTVVDGSPILTEVNKEVQQKLADLQYEFNDVKDREFRTRPPTDLTGWGEDIEGPSSDQALSEEEQKTLCAQQMSELLMTQWMAVEQEVTTKSKSVFSAIRGIRQNAVAHYAKLKEAFAEYLHRPDERALEAMRFQDGFNNIEEWMRSDIEVKQELHLRADELQEKLWDVSDGAREASDAERYALLGDGWLQDKCAECTFQLTKLLQMELMRYQGACMVLETRDKFVKTGELPVAMDLLQVGFELVDALVVPADGQPPRQTAPEDGGVAPVVPPLEQLVSSLRTTLDQCNQLVTSEEDLEAKEECKDELTSEAAVCRHRMRSIVARGEELIGGLCTRANNLGETMLQWLDERYNKEVSSTTGLVQLVREAVEAEEMLMHDLKLDGTDFVIDEGVRVVPYKSEIVETTAETQPLPDRFTSRQLASIHEHLVRCAPSGFIKTEDFTWLLRRVANEGCIPSEWLHEDEDELVAGIRQVLERVDSGHTGNVNWREFLLAAALPQYPTDIELFDMRRNFDAADSDSDGRVTMHEYSTVKLWFDSSDLMAEDLKARLRELIWPLFAVPDPAAPDDDGLRLFDYLAMLLYVSASSTEDAGVRRAFRTMANGDAPMKREEVARIVTGGIGALDDLQVEALGLVFAGKSDAARIQLEPILANPHGKAMMLGQKIYLKKDIYTSTNKQ